ncbi:MAG: phenylalanine--tRNA ligase subunit beta [Alicyclobacillus sp.]|nr:phenylalanine--tRNA ligase subunit beta [Alicyclobacillus sp.]
MKLSYNWLCEYVDVRDVTPEQLAARLTQAGIEVEGVAPRSRVRGVVVAEVTACQPHPHADRLQVCTVHAGVHGTHSVVCGARNVRPGMRAALALPGAELPGQRIERAVIRGVRSEGMLCSAAELGLEVRLLPKEQTEGLYPLPDDAPLGEEVSAYLGLDDVVLDLSLTPNRSDCLSLRGLAYEVGALFNRPVHMPQPSDPAGLGPSPLQVRLDSPLCSRYEAQVLCGLTPRPSPLWLQMRLLASGIRPINLIVDVTNYVMLEWGQPLHAFDGDEVQEQTIVVRQARPGERLVTLDGVERTLDEDVLVIADSARAIGIAGVMGGENSEVRASTRTIVLESASFDAVSVRRTGQRLGLRSEAQQRFEKGIDPLAVRAALLRAADLLCSLGGAQRVGSWVMAGSSPEAPDQVIPFSPRAANQLLGTEVDPAEMAEVLHRLGFGVQQTAADQWLVHVPSRRPDVSMAADLAEEVARVLGYDRIPSTPLQGAATAGVRTPLQRLRKRTREVLTGLGLTEVFTYALTHPAALDALRLPADAPDRRQVTLLLPMSEERSALRTRLLPSLAQVAQYNLARGVTGGQVFEIARVYLPHKVPVTEQPAEPEYWAGLWFGSTEPSVWERPRPYDFYDAKGAVESWLEALGLLEQAEFRPALSPWLHPGRSAEVWLGDTRVGSLGELHPETADRLETGSAVYAEFALDPVLACLSERWRVTRLPRYPAVRRDLAVVVAHQVSAAALLQAAYRAAAAAGEEENLLADCRVFDVYTGRGIPAGHKSVAVALTFRSAERTLTDTQVQAVEAQILRQWHEQFGAVLRAEA